MTLSFKSFHKIDLYLLRAPEVIVAVLQVWTVAKKTEESFAAEETDFIAELNDRLCDNTNKDLPESYGQLGHWFGEENTNEEKAVSKGLVWR